jgi:hypothetical protein
MQLRMVIGPHSLRMRALGGTADLFGPRGRNVDPGSHCSAPDRRFGMRSEGIRPHSSLSCTVSFSLFGAVHNRSCDQVL